MNLMKMINEKNVGSRDKVVRLILGISLLALVITMEFGMAKFDLWVKAVLAFLGLILLVTAVRNSCLLYSLLGVSTSKK